MKKKRWFYFLVLSGCGLSAAIIYGIVTLNVYTVWSILPQFQLKVSPPPLKITTESMNLLPGTDDWVLVYSTHASLDEVVEHYRKELPKQGWEFEIIDHPVETCIKIVKGRNSFVLTIQQFRSENTARIFVYFPDSSGYCIEQFDKSS